MTPTAVDDVCPRSAVDAVLSRPGPHVVVTSTTVKHIGSIVPPELVITTLAEDRIGAIATTYHVVARATAERVDFIASQNDVIASAAVDDIVPPEPTDHIVAITAHHVSDPRA